MKIWGDSIRKVNNMWPQDFLIFATLTTIAGAASVGLELGDYEVLSDTDEKSDRDYGELD